jgi:hypothetical protein
LTGPRNSEVIVSPNRPNIDDRPDFRSYPLEPNSVELLDKGERFFYCFCKLLASLLIGIDYAKSSNGGKWAEPFKDGVDNDGRCCANVIAPCDSATLGQAARLYNRAILSEAIHHDHSSQRRERRWVLLIEWRLSLAARLPDQPMTREAIEVPWLRVEF